MTDINFYFEYRNSQKVQIPVNPEKLSIQSPGNNTTVSIVSLGDVNVLKLPGLQKLSFESFIPAKNIGTYVQANTPIYGAAFYKDFFLAVKRQQEPINFIVSGLGISIQMAVEDFEYWWEGSDPDMHYKLSLKEYKKHSAKIAEISMPSRPGILKATQPAGKATRENTPKKVAIGSKVKVNGRLHRDSYGSGPGLTEKNAIRKVNFIAKGRKCPYHVTTLSGGWRGWVTEGSVEVID